MSVKTIVTVCAVLQWLDTGHLTWSFRNPRTTSAPSIRHSCDTGSSYNVSGDSRSLG
jgi:hypothetical protein